MYWMLHCSLLFFKHIDFMQFVLLCLFQTWWGTFDNKIVVCSFPTLVRRLVASQRFVAQRILTDEFTKNDSSRKMTVFDFLYHFIAFFISKYIQIYLCIYIWICLDILWVYFWICVWYIFGIFVVNNMSLRKTRSNMLRFL